MSRSRSGGFTLVEVTVVMVVGGLLATGLYQLQRHHREMVAWQTRAAGEHDAYRVMTSLLSRDLREAVPSAGDVLVPASDSLIVRAPAGLSFVCAKGSNPPVIALTRVEGRPPATVGDSILLYASGGWRVAAVGRVEVPGAGGLTCAHGARTPSVQIRLASGGTDDVPIGAPVRAFRTHAYHVVNNAGAPWLGRTTPDGTEPLVGPLAARGLRFRLLDTGGTEASGPASVAGAEFRMVFAGSPPDTVTGLLQVRNR